LEARGGPIRREAAEWEQKGWEASWEKKRGYYRGEEGGTETEKREGGPFQGGRNRSAEQGRLIHTTRRVAVRGG